MPPGAGLLCVLLQLLVGASSDVPPLEVNREGSPVHLLPAYPEQREVSADYRSPSAVIAVTVEF